MKKLIACAAALSLLSACAGGSDDDAAAGDTDAAAIDGGAPTISTADLTGSWTYTFTDGVEGMTTVSDDSSFVREMADGTSFTGTLTIDGETACFTETETETRCYTVSAPAGDGSRRLTDEDGTEMVVTPTV